jgi:hypothetical protein
MRRRVERREIKFPARVRRRMGEVVELSEQEGAACEEAKIWVCALSYTRASGVFRLELKFSENSKFARLCRHLIGPVAAGKGRPWSEERSGALELGTCFYSVPQVGSHGQTGCCVVAISVVNSDRSWK